jgi:hypothetical protein
MEASPTESMEKSGNPQGSCLGPLIFLSKASVSTVCMRMTQHYTCQPLQRIQMTATLNKELQLVSEWVANNKLDLNI